MRRACSTNDVEYEEKYAYREKSASGGTVRSSWTSPHPSQRATASG